MLCKSLLKGWEWVSITRFGIVGKISASTRSPSNNNEVEVKMNCYWTDPDIFNIVIKPSFVCKFMFWCRQLYRASEMTVLTKSYSIWCVTQFVSHQMKMKMKWKSILVTGQTLNKFPWSPPHWHFGHHRNPFKVINTATLTSHWQFRLKVSVGLST